MNPILEVHGVFLVGRKAQPHFGWWRVSLMPPNHGEGPGTAGSGSHWECGFGGQTLGRQERRAAGQWIWTYSFIQLAEVGICDSPSAAARSNLLLIIIIFITLLILASIIHSNYIL